MRLRDENNCRGSRYEGCAVSPYAHRKKTEVTKEIYKGETVIVGKRDVYPNDSENDSYSFAPFPNRFRP